MTRIRIISAALLLFLAMLLCTGLPYGFAEAGKGNTVRIGVYLPMTGPMAARGQSEYAGIEIAQKIKPTVLGAKVELFLADTETERAGTAGAANRLLAEHKVHALIGDMSGDNPQGGLSAAEKAKKPTVISYTTMPASIGANSYSFNVSPTNALRADAVARYAYYGIKATRAALLINIESDSSVELSEAFAKNFSEAGGKIVALSYCQIRDSDFTTQLSSIMASKPDVIYMPLSHTEMVRVCRQAAGMEISIPIISSNEAHDPDLVNEGGKDVEGVIVTNDFNIDERSSELANTFFDTYKEETGKDPSQFELLGADSYLLLLDTIERAKSTTGLKMRNALGSTAGFKGLSGIIDMDKEGNAVKKIFIFEIKDGKFLKVKRPDETTKIESKC